MPSFSAASATLNRSASLIASLLNSVVYFLFSFGVGFLLMDHLWSKFTQFLRCPIFAEVIRQSFYYKHDWTSDSSPAMSGLDLKGLNYIFLDKPGWFFRETH